MSAMHDMDGTGVCRHCSADSMSGGTGGDCPGVVIGGRLTVAAPLLPCALTIGRAPGGGAAITIEPDGSFAFGNGMQPTDLAVEAFRALASLIRVARFPLRAQVHEFHRAFGHPILQKPAIPADERVRARASFMAEELCELLHAMFADGEGQNSNIDRIAFALQSIIAELPVRVDMVGVADALADLDYFAEGARLEFGIDGGPIAAEVHRSNMAKLWPDGQVHVRDGDRKVLKPPDWTPPDVAGELRKQGWQP